MAGYFLVTYGAPWDPERISPNMDEGVAHLVKSFFLLPQAEHPVLGVGWTLVHEMYFYVVFAAFLLAPQRWLPWLLAVWAAFIAVGYGLKLNAPNAVTLFTLSNHTMTLEFIAGAFAGLLVVRGWRGFALPCAVISGAMFLVMLSVYTYDESAHMALGNRVIWFGLPATGLVYGLTCLELDGRLRPPRALAALGDISYALYLSHILSFAVMKRVFVGWLGAPGWLDNLAFATASLVLAIAVSIAAYLLFERPSLALLTRWRKSLLRPRGAVQP